MDFYHNKNGGMEELFGVQKCSVPSEVVVPNIFVQYTDVNANRVHFTFKQIFFLPLFLSVSLPPSPFPVLWALCSANIVTYSPYMNAQREDSRINLAL